MCCYGNFPVDTAEHALFVCAKWDVVRKTLGQTVGAELTPDTIVPLMLQSERLWTLIETFVTLVMKYERARWASRVKQRGGPVEIASGTALAVRRLGQIRLSASFGGGFFSVSIDLFSSDLYIELSIELTIGLSVRLARV